MKGRGLNNNPRKLPDGRRLVRVCGETFDIWNCRSICALFRGHKGPHQGPYVESTAATR